LSARFPSAKIVAMMASHFAWKPVRSDQLVQRGAAEASAGWECFVNLRHHQRGSDQPGSTIQFNNRDRRNPAPRLTV